MSSPNLFFPQFCEACLYFDYELSRIESLLEKPEPQAISLSNPSPTQQLSNLPSVEISKTLHIWDHSGAYRCCRSLREFVTRRVPSMNSTLSVNAVLLPHFPELTVPRLQLQVGLNGITKETDFVFSNDGFCSTTPSSRNGLLVRAVGPRFDFAQICQWVSECRVSHGIKCSQSDLPPDWSLLSWDTRDLNFYLIDVRRMCLAISTMSSAPPYVALSYRWDDPTRSTQCRLGNLALMPAPGGLMSEDLILAPMIHDAITFKRDTGFRYIWVDALCIVQDDYERKPTYLSLMGELYAGAVLVLAILEGNADMGIRGIGHDRDIFNTIHLPTRDLIRSTRRITGKEVFSDKTWATRGWTFQEGLFARKMLSIDEFASWHCPCANWLEEVARPPEIKLDINSQAASTQAKT